MVYFIIPRYCFLFQVHIAQPGACRLRACLSEDEILEMLFLSWTIHNIESCGKATVFMCAIRVGKKLRTSSVSSEMIMTIDDLVRTYEMRSQRQSVFHRSCHLYSSCSYLPLFHTREAWNISPTSLDHHMRWLCKKLSLQWKRLSTNESTDQHDEYSVDSYPSWKCYSSVTHWSAAITDESKFIAKTNVHRHRRST